MGKVWGNSKDWVVKLRDGRQIVIPLYLYRSLESVSKSEAILGTDSVLGNGPIISWTDECDGAMDVVSAGMVSECEFWESDEGILSSKHNGESLVVAPLAMENLMVFEYNHLGMDERKLEEEADLEKVDSS